MRYFFCKHLEEVGAVARLAPEENRHLFKTLRARPGETIGLLDGVGNQAVGEVRPGEEVAIAAITRHSEPATKIHLFAAPPRRHKMDTMLKQCAEIGVWSFTPIITERAVAMPDKTGSRWEALLREGCKQSGNPFMPQLFESASLADALKTSDKRRIDYYGVVETTAAAELAASSGDIGWWVGPEGGFSDKEQELLRRHGAVGINLASYTMRVETAAICGAAIIMFETRRRSCR